MVLPIDAFASRKEGVCIPHWVEMEGFWTTSSVIKVFHIDFTKEDATMKLEKCKQLSKYLCKKPLAVNVSKAILVNQQAALYVLATNYLGHLRLGCALALAKGKEDPKKTAHSLS